MCDCSAIKKEQRSGVFIKKKKKARNWSQGVFPGYGNPYRSQSRSTNSTSHIMITFHLNSKVTKKGLLRPKKQKKKKKTRTNEKKLRINERKVASSCHSDELNSGPNLRTSHGSGDFFHTMMS